MKYTVVLAALSSWAGCAHASCPAATQVPSSTAAPPPWGAWRQLASLQLAVDFGQPNLCAISSKGNAPSEVVDALLASALRDLLTPGTRLYAPELRYVLRGEETVSVSVPSPRLQAALRDDRHFVLDVGGSPTVGGISFDVTATGVTPDGASWIAFTLWSPDYDQFCAVVKGNAAALHGL